MPGVSFGRHHDGRPWPVVGVEGASPRPRSGLQGLNVQTEEVVRLHYCIHSYARASSGVAIGTVPGLLGYRTTCLDACRPCWDCWSLGTLDYVTACAGAGAGHQYSFAKIIDRAQDHSHHSNLESDQNYDAKDSTILPIFYLSHYLGWISCNCILLTCNLGFFLFFNIFDIQF